MSQKLKKELPPIELINDQSIGERISETRKKRGFTQKELSEKIGITRRLLSEYETGRTRIYADMVTRIAIALKISTDIIHGLITETKEDKISLRYTKRIKDIETLPEHKIRMILKMIDDSIKANKS